MKYIWRFHDWYDTLQEPWRLLLLLVLASPIITTGLWVNTPMKFYIGVGYLSLLLVPRMVRHHARARRRELKEDD